DWRDLTEASPVVVTCLVMPLTFSIAEGITLGFIAYAAIKLFSGKGRDVSMSVWVMSAIFIVKYLAG
ncbi:TPA: NCS2 family permease, partial [Vibrio parahaemolyticus]|nr:NCS2 family permease [Vibrio parahaemolyticus]